MVEDVEEEVVVEAEVDEVVVKLKAGELTETICPGEGK